MQIPWNSALAAYRTRLADEWAYDRAVWHPAFDHEFAVNADAVKRGDPMVSIIPAAVDAEMDRLTDARCSAEDVFLKAHAPTLADFALKFLVCFDLGRDLDCHRHELCADARRLLGLPEASGDISLGARLQTLDRRISQ